MKIDELDYELPETLIAQHPAPARDASRLLVLDRAKRSMTTTTFDHLPEYLDPGDCLVMNDTRVICARLHGHKATGGRVEIFLLHEEAPGVWTALVRPGRRTKPGTQVKLADGSGATIEDLLPEGRRVVRFEYVDVIHRLEAIGEIPLPPYIHREQAEDEDRSRYQTVYAREPGAVAAPTAGLHYSEAVLEALDRRGVVRAQLTLHVGYGTFKPVTAETIEEHRVDPEAFLMPTRTAEVLNATRGQGGRIVSVGTTCARVLETQHREGVFHAGQGDTNTYIYPPYVFRGVDALQTNFHLPRSSLLALVCAFGGTAFILEAYRHAVREGFRFYSYGDTMLIL